MNHDMQRTRRAGLTLVELLVVLVILAIMTVIAVQSTDVFLEQARFEVTQRTLQNLQNALVSPVGQREPDGTQMTTGFVADIGRLPIATVDSSGALSLSELWSNPNGLPAFGVYPADGPDSDVFVPCGWRGPYLQLAPGASQLLDGWGNPLANTTTKLPALYRADGVTPVTAGQSVQWIRSLGSDFAPNGNDYASDMNVVIESTVPGALVNRFQAAITLNVYFVTRAGTTVTAPPNGTVSSLTVKYFGPNMASVLANKTVTPITSTTPVAGTTFQFPRPSTSDLITIGSRAVRASCSYTYVPEGGTDPVPASLKTPITWLSLQPGGQTKNLYIQLPN